MDVAYVAGLRPTTAEQHPDAVSGRERQELKANG